MIDKDFLTFARSRLNIKDKMLICNVFGKNSNDLHNICKLLKTKAIISNSHQDEIDKEFYNVYRNGYKMISIFDGEYPPLLKQITEPPIVLTIRGETSVLSRNCFAVVGSRESEPDDRDIIKKFVNAIQQADGVVVSGFAKGSDITAHIQSIASGTIAVMPCGLSSCYPKEHEFLIEKIVDFGGAIVSECPFFEPPRQYNFLQRNRIVVGLSNALLVARVRATKSGSMSSVNYAKKQNKQIYTCEFEGASDGNKFLLQNHIAKNVKDFENGFEDLYYHLLCDIASEQLKTEANNNDDNNISDKVGSKNNEKNTRLFDDKVDVATAKNEIKKIMKASKASAKLNSRNISEIFDKCQKILQIDPKILLTAILEEMPVV